MKKYGLPALITAVFLTSSVYAHSQDNEESSAPSKPVTENSTTENIDDQDEKSQSSENGNNDETPSRNTSDNQDAESTRSPREQYDGIGDNINYSDPSNSNYIAPPIFPFPDAYVLRLPQKITVEDVQVHPPILPYPHRKQYEIEENLSGNSNRS